MLEDLSDIVAGEIELLATGFQYTEGPLWHPAGHWHFVDTRPNLVFKMVPGSQPEVFRQRSGRANGLTFDLQGRLLMCEGYGRRISRMESDGTVTTLADSFDGKRLNRPNDIVCHSSGTIYFTDPQELVAEEDRELGSSAVFRVSPNGRIEPIIWDVTYPNGLAFSPDERVLYLVDFPSLILAYDVNDWGLLNNKRLFIAIKDDTNEGHPDGIKVDTDGRVYSTGPGGLWVMDAHGAHLGTLTVPEAANNCGFGGENYDAMLITGRTSIYSVPLKTTGVTPPGARALAR